jgi:hypothetical protein
VKWIALLLTLAALVAVVGYQFGLHRHLRETWPAQVVRDWRHRNDPVPVSLGRHDELGRLTSYPGKTEVACPPAGSDTAVLLAIGQSNIANHAETSVATRHPGRVVNLFDGKCYAAASPLLGATGEGGEFLTLLADRLVADGLYRNVVIVSSAMGGTAIAKWRRGGVLNTMMQRVIAGLPSGYKPTHVLWVQGEADFVEGTSAETYTRSFRSLVETLSEAGVKAPIFLAIATNCGAGWIADNAIAQAQRALVDGKQVFLGADTDALLGEPDRREDKCHYGASGQAKAAEAFAQAIARVRRP